ncbi:hypothetical protein [Akkermansia muciniphila]|uniref:hypothetical protein n=1 Tax=Akkermansia muciniphila TaxID=239935 RepID=UPI003F8DD3DE
MNIRQLKQLPSAGFIFLLGCIGIWLGVNQYASSLIYERQRLSNEQDALIELTKKLKFEQKKSASDDAASSLVERIQQGWIQDYEKRIQEYRELFLIQTAIKEKTFNKQISELSDIQNKLNRYIRSYNYIAEQMNQRAK